MATSELPIDAAFGEMLAKAGTGSGTTVIVTAFDAADVAFLTVIDSVPRAARSAAGRVKNNSPGFELVVLMGVPPLT